MKTSTGIFLLFSLLITGNVSAQDNPFRNSEIVRKKMIGYWESNDYVYNPHQIFVGTKEEKDAHEKEIRTLNNQFMPVVKMHLYANGKAEVELIYREIFNKPAEKRKGSWSLEDDGDVLMIDYKKIGKERQKVISIDDKNMETLVSDTSNFKMIIHWQKR